jgi:hypothetical protein
MGLSGPMRVCPMRMGMVMVRMGMRWPGVSSAFRIERRLDRNASAAEQNDQRFQRGLAPQANAIGKKLNRHVPVTEMKRDPCQCRRIRGAHFDQRLGLGHDFDQPAVLELERVSHPQPRRLGEREGKLETLDAPPLAAMRPALCIVENDGIDEACQIEALRRKHPRGRGNGALDGHRQSVEPERTLVGRGGLGAR